MPRLGSYETMIEEMKSGVYDYTVDGECSNCGQCCSNFLPISAKEIKAIHRYIRKHDIKEQRTCWPTVEPVTDFTCPFRSDNERKCLVYEVRPLICRDFQCDKPRKGIWAERDLLQSKYGVVDMRAEFYGQESFFARVFE